MSGRAAVAATPAATTGAAASPAAYARLAGRRIAFVESMLHTSFYAGMRAAGELGADVRVLVRDREWYGAPADWRDHPLGRVALVEIADTFDADAVAARLTGPGGRPDVDAVLSFSDYHTELAATVARRLGLPGADAAAYRLANDKAAMRAALRGLPSAVPHRLVTTLAGAEDAGRALGYPLVLKPPQEAISHGVRLVPSPGELAAAFGEVAGIRRSLRGQPRAGHVLVEQYVPGEEVSVETLTVAGRTHLYGVTSKALRPPPTFLECAHSFPHALPDAVAADVLATVSAALAGIGYDSGPAHTEVKLTPDGVRLVEINPRLAAHRIPDLVAEVCGRNQHLDAMLLACGEPVPPFPVSHAGGAAVVVLYPPHAGRLADVDATAAEAAGAEVDRYAEPGDPVGRRVDNSAGIGLVLARGDDAAGALRAAEAAAAAVRITVVRQ